MTDHFKVTVSPAEIDQVLSMAPMVLPMIVGAPEPGAPDPLEQLQSIVDRAKCKAAGYIVYEIPKDGSAPIPVLGVEITDGSE